MISAVLLAGIVGFAVLPEHLAQWWAFGVFFAAIGWFEALWALAFPQRAGRAVIVAGVIVLGATVGLSVWTRVIGVPVGPTAGRTEAVCPEDVVASLLEIVLVGLLIALVWRPLPVRLERISAPRGSMRAAAMFAIAMIVFAVTAAVFLAPSGSRRQRPEYRRQLGVQALHGRSVPVGRQVERQRPRLHYGSFHVEWQAESYPWIEAITERETVQRARGLVHRIAGAA